MRLVDVEFQFCNINKFDQSEGWELQGLEP